MASGVGGPHDEGVETTSPESDLLRERADRCRRTALAVGGTRACGSVLHRARDLYLCPEGGWPDTRAARRALIDAVADASNHHIDDSFLPDEVEMAAEMILEHFKTWAKERAEAEAELERLNHYDPAPTTWKAKLYGVVQSRTSFLQGDFSEYKAEPV